MSAQSAAEIRRVSASKSTSEDVVASHVQELKASGYCSVTASMILPNADQVETLIVPYKEDDSPERMKEIMAQLTTLSAGGYAIGGSGDTQQLGRFEKAPMDPTAISFAFPGETAD